MRHAGSTGERALLTGATGLIGAKQAGRLADAVVLSRDPERARRKLGAGEAHAWLPEDGPAPVATLANLDAVFHLAGEAVAEGRWTARAAPAVPSGLQVQRCVLICLELDNLLPV